MPKPSCFTEQSKAHLFVQWSLEFPGISPADWYFIFDPFGVGSVYFPF